MNDELDLELNFAPEDQILLVTPYTHEQYSTMQSMDLQTQEELYAFFEYIKAQDPGQEKFLSLVGGVALKNKLQCGWIADDQMIMTGERAAIERAHKEISPHYNCGTYSGAKVLSYLENMGDGKFEVLTPSAPASDGHIIH